MNIIELKDLDFSFGKEQILKKINLTIPKGSIYGFLGPNGAGKSTTIRILMNLYHAPYQQVQLFGKSYKNNRNEILKKTGALIEMPSLYDHLTAYQNLNITRKLLGLDEKEIMNSLGLVKLEFAAHKKIAQYSLGMKQRLGIALALLGERELLILDEPTNGLDPKGIIEIRELLLQLNKDHGITIFISSHILSEIDRLVSDVAIINKGEVLFNGKIQELREKNNAVFMLEASDIKEAKRILQDYSPLERDDGKLELVIQTKEEKAKVNRLIIESGLDLYSSFSQEKSLEEIFLDMTDIEEKP